MTGDACEAASAAQAEGSGSWQAEPALVARARRGDGHAFEQLHRQFRNRIFTLCLNLCANREEASDLLQETFLRAWRGVRSFDGRSEFSTWLYQIALNTCRDAHRKRRRPLPPLPGLPRSDAAAVTRVRAALGRLHEPHRVALTLRYAQGLSYQEIADCLAWTLPQVKMTLHRAKVAFREAYLELREEEP